MTKQAETNENKLVALASIAAVLHGVKNVAWGVSLAAKNAKVISAQAGEKGLGFQPITDFIDEISQMAMKSVNDISEEALKLSKISVEEQRTYDAYLRFSKVRNSSNDARYINSMSGAMKRVEQNMQETTTAFKKSLNALIILLEEMNKNMLSARSIASVSRIVTSDAQEYRAKLEVVANDLDEAAIYIKDKVSDSYHYLNKVNVLSIECA